MLRFDGYAGTLAEQPLSMAEIAEELAIAPRTLRSICGRFLGMSPHAYVVAKRLDAARIALHEADPATQTLASIANAFGFRRPDRFAAIYRVAFGENPSLTARSAPPSRIT